MPNLALVNKQAPEQLPDRERIERSTASFEEMGRLLRRNYDAVRNRAARGHWMTGQFPSSRQQGKLETRILLSQLKEQDFNLYRRLMRLRRRDERKEQNLPAHHGGEVVREDDARQRVTPAEKATILKAWKNRGQPSVSFIYKQITACCIRCHLAPMSAIDRTYQSNFRSHTCENPECRFSISYATVWRAIWKTAPEQRDLGRIGINTWNNKYGAYADRSKAVLPRNEKVFGDHHRIDVECWDPRHPRTSTQKPRLLHLWLSAWEDWQTGVVGWEVVERPNALAIGLALRRYCLRWGLPKEAWSDNGKDYLSDHIETVCRSLEIEQHFTNPSQRTGVSHGRSKLIERWFGSFELGQMREIPGWTTSDTVQRAERQDVLWALETQHKEFLKGERSASPLWTVDQVRTAVDNWIEQHYLVTAQNVERRNYLSPVMAYESGVNRLRTVGTGKFNERAMDILLMRTKAAIVGRNGVEWDGRTYWDNKLFGLRGLPCTTRVDPADVGRAYILVHQPGKADIFVEAAEEKYSGWSEEDLRREKSLAKEEREVRKANDERLLRHAHGLTPYHMILAEKAAANPPEPQQAVVNGNPLLTEGHRIAAAAEASPLRAAGFGIAGNPRPRPQPDPEPEQDGAWAAVPEMQMTNEPPEPQERMPEFDYDWQREEWERARVKETHGPDIA